MTANRKAFNLFEVVITICLLTVVFSAVINAFIGAGRSTTMGMQMMVVNDDIQRLARRVVEDVRNAHYIFPESPASMPPFLGITDYAELNTMYRNPGKPDNPGNSLVLVKLHYDFSQASPIAEKTVVKYRVRFKGHDPSASGCVYLERAESTYDVNTGTLKKKGKPVTVAKDFDIINFYRINGFGENSVFFRFFRSRRDVRDPSAPTYLAKLVGSAKVRSSPSYPCFAVEPEKGLPVNIDTWGW